MPTKMTNNRNNNLSRAIGLLFLVAGALMAYLVIGALTSMQGNPEAKKTRAPGDTLYVKLTNGGIQGSPASQGETGGKAKNADTADGRPVPTGPSAIDRRGYVKLPPQPGLPQDSVIKAFSPYRVDGTSGNVRYLLVVCLIVLLLAGIVYVHRIPLISRNIRKDRDPQTLDRVFRECGSAINEMRNPRRIKRFSNKVRFHYYYLYNGKSLSYKDLLDVVKILLYLEVNHSVMDLERSDGDSENKGNAWFFREVVVKVLGPKSGRSADDWLMAKVFELNKNIIV